MECSKCGKALPEGQTVCPDCEAEQTAEPKMISLSELNEQEMMKKAKKPLSRKQLLIRIAIIAVSVLAALAVVLVSIFYATIAGNIQQASQLSGDLGIQYDLPEGVINIALFGLDTRQNNDSGRSDSMIILSIDQIHNQIKLTSLARDTLVSIDGYGKSKLTHAWAYGKAALAVKTINQNFGMNIEDYVYVNFYEFAGIIDYIGGVYIDVDASEMRVMNRTYAPYLRKAGINCPDVTVEGYQLLCGGQALAYARNRYTGSDLDRGDRQKEVLEAMFAAVKDVSIAKYPTLISKILSMCHTSLTSSEMMGLATWAMTKMPTFHKFGLPSKELNAWGGTTQYGWVWIYDMSLATTILHDFIYGESTDLTTISTTGREAVLPQTTESTEATTEATRRRTTRRRRTTTRRVYSTTRRHITTTYTTTTTAGTTVATDLPADATTGLTDITTLPTGITLPTDVTGTGVTDITTLPVDPTATTADTTLPAETTGSDTTSTETTPVTETTTKAAETTTTTTEATP